MPNLESQFQEFYKTISLSSAKKADLRTSRDSDEEAIKNYFKEKLKEKVPSFEMQGSYIMGTIVNPIEGGEYDLDDGVYLNNLPTDFRNDKNHIINAHDWIKKALQEKTKGGVDDTKKACVRLIYSKNYHIDFPIYCIENGVRYLAHKTNGWTISCPDKLKEWFDNQTANSNQIINVVKYLKAGKDYNDSSSQKYPSGMVITVLVINHFVADQQDQYSFLETCRKIYNTLSTNFYLMRPVDPYENLLAEYSESRKKGFLDKLSNLISNGDAAIKCEKPSAASQKWIKVFGDRFHVAEDPKETDTPSILRSNGRSA